MTQKCVSFWTAAIDKPKEKQVFKILPEIKENRAIPGVGNKFGNPTLIRKRNIIPDRGDTGHPAKTFAGNRESCRGKKP
jgi:hypothetical protein